LTIGSEKNENGTLIMFDAAGKEVYRKPIGLQKGTNRFTLDGSRFIQGNYFLKLVSESRSETIKLIRQ